MTRAFLFGAVWATSSLATFAQQVQPHPHSPTLEAQETVTRYLKAWQVGDYNTVYYLLDAEERSMLTPEQFRDAFKVQSKGTNADKEALRRITGFPYLVTGRPSHFNTISVTLKPNGTVIANSVVDFDPLTEIGLGQSTLSSKFLNQYLKSNTGANNKDGFSVAMGFVGLTQTDHIDTSKGQAKSVYSVAGPPYITLYLHSFLLTKEAGKWHITNAVKISDMPPVVP